MTLDFRIVVVDFLSLALLAACSTSAPLPTLMPTVPADTPLPPPTATSSNVPPSLTPVAASSTPLLAATPRLDTSTPVATETPVLSLIQQTATASPAPPALARILSLESPMLQGDDILQLQKRLLALAYTEMPTPDGYFGQKTQAAIRHFQQVNGLPIDGIVGPQTWAAVFSPAAIASPLVTLLPSAAVAPTGEPTRAVRVLALQSPPLTGPDVSQLQKQLWELGYYPCDVDPLTVLDGIFGAQTEAAVRRFQENNGLEANGRAGPEVQTRLASPSAAASLFGPVSLPPPVDLPPSKAGYLAAVYGLDVFVVDADLGNLTWQLTANGTSYDPAWSPDGGRILFVSKHANGDELFVASANGAGLTQITCSRLLKHHPVWSPDGSQILFAGVAQVPASTGLYVMNADGSAVSLIPGSTFGLTPAWSRTNRIAFAVEAKGAQNIYAINPDGSDLQPLTSGAGYNGSPAWSPDGSQIVYVSDRDGQPQLFLMSADGANQRPLSHLRYQTDNPSPLANLSWSPGGAQGAGRIAFGLWSGGSSKIGVINADGTGLFWYMLAGLSEPDWKP